MKKYTLITGCCGFIGFHTTLKILNKDNVIGIDNLNNYYSTKLKKDRLTNIKKKNSDAKKNRFIFFKVDISNNIKLEKIFKKYKINYVINLAAQAGVRYSLINPKSYTKSNLVGFANILEISKKYNVKHLVYASTSSVYGANTKLPFSESDSTDHQIQYYAATKRANELMAHSYSCVHNLNTTGLRFFTVYGPWGRPDMALFLFTKNILNKKKINVFNYGKHVRDFTYIDDIVNGIFKVYKKPPKKQNIKKWELIKDPSNSYSPFQILNIGNSQPIALSDYISAIEKCLNIKSKKKFLPLQKGDVKETFSDIVKIKKKYKYSPRTPFQTGVSKFISWYLKYYKIKKINGR